MASIFDFGVDTLLLLERRHSEVVIDLNCNTTNLNYDIKLLLI